MRFDENPFIRRCEKEKRRQKCLWVSNLSLLLVVFKWHHCSEGDKSAADIHQWKYCEKFVSELEEEEGEEEEEEEDGESPTPFIKACFGINELKGNKDSFINTRYFSSTNENIVRNLSVY